MTLISHLSTLQSPSTILIISPPSLTLRSLSTALFGLPSIRTLFSQAIKQAHMVGKLKIRDRVSILDISSPVMTLLPSTLCNWKQSANTMSPSSTSSTLLMEFHLSESSNSLLGAKIRKSYEQYTLQPCTQEPFAS